MDQDGDGSIRESEFLKLFRNMNRDFLQKQLVTQVDKSSSEQKKLNVKIIDFGFNDRKGQYQEHNFDEKNVAEIVKVKPVSWKKHIRWIDIHGDAPEVIQLLANDWDVPPFIVDETALKHAGKVQFYPEHEILEIVTHRVALEHVPTRPMTAHEIRSRQKNKPPQSAEEEPEREHHRALVLGKAYSAPEMRSAQVMLLCFGDHTVLTVRRRTHVPEIANVFNEIPTDIKSFSAEVRSHMEITSTREFMCSLLNEITEQNWLLKDQFKEWKITLEKEINLNLAPGQSRHIMDMDRTSNTALRLLEPFDKSMSKVFQLEEDEEGEEKETKKLKKKGR